MYRQVTRTETSFTISCKFFLKSRALAGPMGMKISRQFCGVGIAIAVVPGRTCGSLDAEKCARATMARVQHQTGMTDRWDDSGLVRRISKIVLSTERQGCAPQAHDFETALLVLTDHVLPFQRQGPTVNSLYDAVGSDGTLRTISGIG